MQSVCSVSKNDTFTMVCPYCDKEFTCAICFTDHSVYGHIREKLDE